MPKSLPASPDLDRCAKALADSIRATWMNDLEPWETMPAWKKELAYINTAAVLRAVQNPDDTLCAIGSVAWLDGGLNGKAKAFPHRYVKPVRRAWLAMFATILGETPNLKPHCIHTDNAIITVEPKE